MKTSRSTVGKMPIRASRLLKQAVTSIQYDFSSLSTARVTANLTKVERSPLKKFVKNENLVICKADKGDITVIMATLQYLDLAKHLGDEGTYKPLETDPTQEIVKQFNSYLDTCLGKGMITKSQHVKLYLKSKVDIQTKYFLPKVHKDLVTLRPIVSCTGGPTTTASAYLDRLLQYHMKKVKSHLSNSTKLVHKLRTLRVLPHAYIVTLDIESLYTKMVRTQPRETTSY